MDNHLQVAYATDNGYIKYTGISMYSLFDNNKNFDDITVHILDNGISDEGKKQLKDIADLFSRTIIFYDCSKIGEWLGNEVLEMFERGNTNISISSYARLFLPQLVSKDVDKILYLDADSIVIGSFRELWKIDNGNFSIMGVIDNVSAEAKERIGLSDKSRYINAGVVLMNIEMLRNMNFTELVKAFIAKYHGCVYHHDQGVINGVLHSTIGYLMPQYNMMSYMFETKTIVDTANRYMIENYYSDEEMRYAENHPVFIHFTEGNLQRPWVQNCKHPLRDKWIYYKNKTI